MHWICSLPNMPSAALLQHLHEDVSYSSALFLPLRQLKTLLAATSVYLPFFTGGDSHCVFPCRRMTNSLFPAEISVFLTGFLCKAIKGKPEMSVSPEQAAATRFHYLPHVWKRDLSLHGQRPHAVNQGLRP